MIFYSCVESQPWLLTNRLLLIMKLVVFLTLITVLQATAGSFAQTITLSARNVPLPEVMEHIQAQSGYLFFLKGEKLAKIKVNTTIRKTELKEAMDMLTKDLGLEWVIEGKTIILRSATQSVLKQTITDTELQAQERVITGNVVDESGNPLEGVTVSVKGTATATTTDARGNYRITLPNGGNALVFSILGFSVMEQPIGSQNTINVSLKTSISDLDEVVVVGYGTEKRINLTGAIDQVTADDIKGRPATNVLTALQGESPNLIIQQTNHTPGSSVNLNIRGLGTFGDNNPLVVIDGVIGGDINQVNPNDIASISILKDAGSSAIYGSRAANGVILVTTKKGNLNRAPAIDYNGTYGIQHSAVLLNKVDAWKNAEYKNQSLTNSGLPPAYTAEEIQQFREQGNGTWDQEHLMRNAPFQTHSLSISGGGENNAYFISGGYQNQSSNMIGNGGSGSGFGYQNYNLRLNQSTTLGKLKVNVILNYNKSQNKTPSHTQANIFADANRIPYQFSYQDADGNYPTNALSTQVNPMRILKEGGFNQTDNDQIFGNLNGTYDITNDLKVTAILGGTIRNNASFFRTIQLDYLPSGVSGNDRRVRDNSVRSLLVNAQVFAEYNKTINNSTYKVLVGVSNESFTQKGFQLQQQFTDPILGVPTTGTVIEAGNSNNTVANTSMTSINSLFGRLSYSYKDRYFLEGTFREDGSSKFESSRRWGFFPSIGASWLVSSEPFMDFSTSAINTLKLRTTYGILGNQNVNAYQFYSTYSTYGNAYGFNNNVVNGANYNLGNPDLSWESSATLNLGLDAAFLNNKLRVTLEYFNKVTSDILYSRQDIPGLYGATLPDYNVAKVRNRGWEVNVGYDLQTGEFDHKFGFNISDTRNTVLNLSFGMDQQIQNRGEFAFIRQVGYPITEYYSYKVAGIFQTQEEADNSPKPGSLNLAPGDLKFVDANNDGVINSQDRVRLGDPFPHFTYGFNYGLSYKAFDLSFLIQGVGQRSSMIRGELVHPYQANYGATMFEHQEDFWTPENTDAKFPRLGAVGSNSVTNNWTNGSTIFLFDAAYARLKNLNVGYSFAPELLKQVGIQTLRVSFIAQNLLTISKLDWVDPETSEFGNNVPLSASSNSARGYPLPVTYHIGLNLVF